MRNLHQQQRLKFSKLFFWSDTFLEGAGDLTSVSAKSQYERCFLGAGVALSSWSGLKHVAIVRWNPRYFWAHISPRKSKKPRVDRTRSEKCTNDVTGLFLKTEFIVYNFTIVQLNFRLTKSISFLLFFNRWETHLMLCLIFKHFCNWKRPNCTSASNETENDTPADLCLSPKYDATKRFGLASTPEFLILPPWRTLLQTDYNANGSCFDVLWEHNIERSE